RENGAVILTEPIDQPYGERQYNAQDFYGHRWDFTETIRDVAPEEWSNGEFHLERENLSDTAQKIPASRMTRVTFAAVLPLDRFYSVPGRHTGLRATARPPALPRMARVLRARSARERTPRSAPSPFVA